MKIIKIDDETHDTLMKLGMKGESFDQVIRRIIAGIKKEDMEFNPANKLIGDDNDDKRILPEV